MTDKNKKLFSPALKVDTSLSDIKDTAEPRNEVVKAEKKQELNVSNQAGDITQLIQTALHDEKITPDKLNGLLDFQERVMAKQAEMSFNDALNRLQMNMPIINKDGSVDYKEKKGAFKYASFENIMKIIKPLLQAEGFVITFDSEERATNGGGAVITATLRHKDGYSIQSKFAAALDNSGGKNDIQGMGSTFSYGKRYCVTALLNIVTEGEDDDGNTDWAIESIDDAQFNELQRLIEETTTDAAKFCAHLEVTSIKAITQKQYLEAINLLKDKAKKQQAKGEATQ